MIRITNEEKIGSYGRPYGFGFLYILKHGLGGGVLPNDVKVLKSVDLDSYYTAVWLDRALEYDELKEYDIPSETELSKYKERSNFYDYVSEEDEKKFATMYIGKV